jgi:cytochrome c5
MKENSIFRVLLVACLVSMAWFVGTACEGNAPKGEEVIRDGAVTEPTPEATAEVIPEAAQEAMPEAVAEATPEAVVEATTEEKGACVPNRSAWDNHAKALFENYCSQCHGDPTDFGAPYGVLDYDDIIKGAVGARKIDRMLARMLDHTMPPIGGARPTHEDMDTMIGWLSCGEKHPDHSKGLQSSAPAYRSPKDPPQGVPFFDLRAPNFPVGERTLDLYQCFVFEAPVQEDRFIRRMEVVIGESRVLHHAVFLRDKNTSRPLRDFECRGLPANTDYLYAWAPGAGPVQFPDGGLRVKKGDRFIVQIHYNNGAGIAGVQDTSGIRVYHDAPQGTEYGMISPGPMTFSIPAGQTKSVTSGCTFNQRTRVLAGMPHMHEIGTEFFQEIVRKDGTKEPFIQLRGWSFEMQLFYNTPAILEVGDRLLTTCTWQNPGAQTVVSGTRTKDEMCFNFMYVTPPNPNQFCDEPADLHEEISYTPGACAAPDAEKALQQVRGGFQLGQIPALNGGTFGEETWLLDQMVIYIAQADTPFGKLDLNKSELEGKAQIKTGARIHLDAKLRFKLMLESGLSFNQDFPVSLAGAFQQGAQPHQGRLQADCGGAAADFTYEVEEDTLKFGTVYNLSGFRLNLFFTFKRKNP